MLPVGYGALYLTFWPGSCTGGAMSGSGGKCPTFGSAAAAAHQGHKVHVTKREAARSSACSVHQTV